MVAILSPEEALTHAPVLVEEVIRFLAVQPGGRYLDCTTGGGGHATAILEAASPAASCWESTPTPGPWRSAAAA